MKGSELMYFDLASEEANVVVDDNPSFNTGNKFEEGNVITRMAFASDGYGYAITNDGKNMIRFTTDQKPSISNLGELIDGKKNGTMSVHSQCSSWGGDMVGDTYGNLYMVTYRNHLFKINPKTRITDYLGPIKGLPAEFTE
jgi:signal transduction histidine kinase